MANKDLQDQYFNCSDEVIHKLNNALVKYEHGGDTSGYKRAKGIVEDKRISYQQMKRIKNYFDNYDYQNNNKDTDPEYILNGGDVMKIWVDKTLGNSRDNIHDYKKTRMNAGAENMFKKTHTKDRDNAKPTNVNLPKIHKGSQFDNIMNNRVQYESLEAELQKTKYLIEYMTNNNSKINII